MPRARPRSAPARCGDAPGRTQGSTCSRRRCLAPFPGGWSPPDPLRSGGPARPGSACGRPRAACGRRARGGARRRRRRGRTRRISPGHGRYPRLRAPSVGRAPRRSLPPGHRMRGEHRPQPSRTGDRRDHDDVGGDRRRSTHDDGARDAAPSTAPPSATTGTARRPVATTRRLAPAPSPAAPPATTPPNLAAVRANLTQVASVEQPLGMAVRAATRRCTSPRRRAPWWPFALGGSTRLLC